MVLSIRINDTCYWCKNKLQNRNHEQQIVHWCSKECKREWKKAKRKQIKSLR